MGINTILLILALVLALLAAAGISRWGVHFGWLAVAVYFLSLLV